MGKLKKTTIVRFLEKKLSLNRKLYNEKLEFQSDARIFVSENLTPYNQHLAWKCRELKRASKIHSCWSAKDEVKIRRTMNERPAAINHDTDNGILYTLILFSKWERDQGELFFKEITNSGWVDQDVVLAFIFSLIMITKNHSNIPSKSNMSLS